MIRIQLPYHLQNLGGVGPEVTLGLEPPYTVRTVLTALEARYPALRSAIVDVHTGKRRPLIRFYVCQQDISHEGLDHPLPAAIIEGREPFLVIGAISGG
ncbi:MAG TPA: MoaD/ThiS family protein [Candidatus Acidoferrum sp.]|nr:MoaD/ThiS family protein [Candidatus Acidoferrum sp.]